MLLRASYICSRKQGHVSEGASAENALQMAAKMAATKMSSVTEVFIGGGEGDLLYAGVLRKRYSLAGCAGGGGCAYGGVLHPPHPAPLGNEYLCHRWHFRGRHLWRPFAVRFLRSLRIWTWIYLIPVDMTSKCSTLLLLINLSRAISQSSSMSCFCQKTSHWKLRCELYVFFVQGLALLGEEYHQFLSSWI